MFKFKKCFSVFIITSVLALGIPLTAMAADTVVLPNPASTIAYPADVEKGGAASVLGTVNFPANPYFKAFDFYDMKSAGTLTLLPKFKTYQQSTEYTCGPASAVMVANYFGKSLHEMEFAKKIGTQEDCGTNTQQMVDGFKSMGWTVASSLDKNTDGTAKVEPSLTMLQNNLKKGIPTMVEWIDWGGHWQVVIGYDTMGTETEADDVVIMADPYDTSDQMQDGYYLYPAERFFYMWFDAHLFPEEMQNNQWLTAVPADFKG